MTRFYKNSLLTNKQKGLLCMIARQAYDRLQELGLTDDLSFKEWRRQEQKEAYGNESLTKAHQEDYAPIKAHFQKLADLDDQAYHTYLKDDPESQRQEQTFWHLENVAEEIGVVLIRADRAKEKSAGKGYILSAAKSILRKPRLTWDGIKDLDPVQIGNLVINGKRNLKALQKKYPK